jgi:hypothetical protein
MRASLLVLVVVLASATAVRAEVPALAGRAPSPAVYTNSYRLQLLIADVVALGLVGGGLLAERDELLIAGAAGVVVGAPVVHLANGNPPGALGSGLARGIAPLVGAYAGFLLIDLPLWSTVYEDEDDGAGWVFPAYGAVAGFGVGLVGGLAVDYLFLAKQEGSATWAPTVAPTAGGMSVGLVGRF